MGSEYELFRNGSRVLSIYEMSNILSLDMDNEDCDEYDPGPDACGIDISDITPAEMLTIMIKGLEVCSYWMDQDEFKKQLTEQLKEKRLL